MAKHGVHPPGWFPDLELLWVEAKSDNFRGRLGSWFEFPTLNSVLRGGNQNRIATDHLHYFV
jgi:hypothetical protein